MLMVGPLLLAHTLAAQDSVSFKPANRLAKVVAINDPLATATFKADPQRVEAMVNTGLMRLTEKATAAAAWTNLVSPNEIIGIKVYTAPGADVGTRLEVTTAVVKGLLAAGIPTHHIIVWDRYEASLRRAGYFELTNRFGIRVAGATETGFDADTFYDTALMGNLVYGDLEFGSKDEHAGRKSFVSKLVSREMTKIINIAPLLNHNGAGVTGNLLSLTLGSVDNIVRFETSPARLATAVPEIYALPALGDRVILNISDALLCQYQGEERGLLHYSVALNEIRFSHDPVALDVLALKDLERVRESKTTGVFPINWELYKNAALLELGVADPDHIDVVNVRL